jgi:hypothetical protein
MLVETIRGDIIPLEVKRKGGVWENKSLLPSVSIRSHLFSTMFYTSWIHVEVVGEVLLRSYESVTWVQSSWGCVRVFHSSIRRNFNHHFPQFYHFLSLHYFNSLPCSWFSYHVMFLGFNPNQQQIWILINQH